MESHYFMLLVFCANGSCIVPILMCLKCILHIVVWKLWSSAVVFSYRTCILNLNQAINLHFFLFLLSFLLFLTCYKVKLIQNRVYD